MRGLLAFEESPFGACQKCNGHREISRYVPALDGVSFRCDCDEGATLFEHLEVSCTRCGFRQPMEVKR